MTTGRPRYRRKDKANMGFREIGCKDVNFLRMGFNDEPF
jgi:hypothetical protein